MVLKNRRRDVMVTRKKFSQDRPELERSLLSVSRLGDLLGVLSESPGDEREKSHNMPGQTSALSMSQS